MQSVPRFSQFSEEKNGSKQEPFSRRLNIEKYFFRALFGATFW